VKKENYMKKLLLLGLMGLMGQMGNVAQAQFGDYGVRAGLGFATIDDDLGFKTPVTGVTLGGYINYTFANTESIFAETLYLQAGLNLNRRGGEFEDVVENGTNMVLREGYYHSWYVQLPILAHLHYELPLRKRGHVVGVFIGPQVSFGLFGGYGDRKISPGVSSPSANYDVQFNGSPEDRKLFNHLNRFDVGGILGVSYEYGKFNLSFYLDQGFLATSEGDDILRIIENAQNNKDINVKIPNGHNVAYMFSVCYKLGSLSE
jgi:hypothetical protein